MKINLIKKSKSHKTQYKLKKIKKYLILTYRYLSFKNCTIFTNYLKIKLKIRKSKCFNKYKKNNNKTKKREFYILLMILKKK